MMVLFEIYTKKVDFTDATGTKKELELRPLSGRYLGKLFNAAKVFDGVEEADMLEKMDEKIIGDLHFIVLETLKTSYPKEDEKLLDEFASQNLFRLLEPVIEVNVAKQSE